MSRVFPSLAGFALAVLVLVAASPSRASSPGESIWLVCYARDDGSKQTWVSAIHRTSVEQARDGDRNGWLDHVTARFGPAGPLSGGCSIEASEKDAGWRRAMFTDTDPPRLTKVVEVPDWTPDFTAAAQIPTPILGTAPTVEADAQFDGIPIIIPASAQVERMLADAPELSVTVKESVARPVPALSESEADFQRRMAEYQQQLAEQQRQVEAYRRAKADVARTKLQQRLAAERATAEYVRHMQAHRETLRRHQLEVGRHAANATGDTRVK